MRAFRQNPDQGRLTLALLLAFGLHAVLLFGVSVDWRQSFPQPTPPPFETRLAHPEPALIAPLVEPALMEWLPPALSKPALPETAALASAPKVTPAPKVPKAPKPQPKPVATSALQAPTPRPAPVVTPAPKPQPRPVAQLAPKAPPVAKPLPKPATPPQSKPASKPQPRTDDLPLPKPVATVKPAEPPVARRSQNAERSRSSTRVAPAHGPLDSTALLGQIASLDIEQQRKESARRRVQRVSPTDSRSAAGFYAADWARKVTRVGEMNFPDMARRLNTSAGPLLEVAIRADGGLREVRIVRSSGHTELDQAAQRIVKMAAPYPPFPSELRQETDLLRIEAPWRFDPGGRIRAR